jgi:hypothetical protein
MVLTKQGCAMLSRPVRPPTDRRPLRAAKACHPDRVQLVLRACLDKTTPRTRDAQRVRATLNGASWQGPWFGPQGPRLGDVRDTAFPRKMPKP